ncbi:hypothetical protein D0859_15079 [Hortaea werneckii]|uniref:NTF2-related export protein n=1 Tax=Hortaea werneckii TaxID=91943 RepID=A0A3M7I662_HORWE|nr:hypothetical protein D0859_15079 [Hortaea werneckii]
MADFENIAKQFVEYGRHLFLGGLGFYYKQFDSDRSGLASLYGNDSMLTFEAAPCQGVANIIQKLQDLPFKQVQHQVSTLDAQPSNASGGILVIVTGALLVEEEKRPMSYSQTFQLMPREGSYYVFNDIFRLVYPAA